MHIKIDNQGLKEVAALFDNNGRSVRLVGGAVRDLILGKVPKDFDIATDATPEESIAIAERAGYRVIPTGLKHGTITIVVRDEPFEVTTLRRDVDTDGRHATVEYVRDYRLDAARRDFTINAMSASLDGRVHDYFGGVEDALAGRVRFVGSARARIEEDYLRILRFFRFRSRFSADAYDIETIEAIRALEPGLERISGERKWLEISKLVRQPSALREFDLMIETGVASRIGLPTDKARYDIVPLLAPLVTDAALVLGTVLRDPGDVHRIAVDWKLSNKERYRALIAAEVVTNPSYDPHEWRCIVSDARESVEDISALLAATGRTEASQAVTRFIPEFPLRGRDLLAAGHPPGPELGLLMEDARRLWKESGFALDCDELIRELATRVPGPR